MCPALVKEANKIRKLVIYPGLSKNHNHINTKTCIKEINNVRPISLINCALRLISSVVNRRIQKAMINSKYGTTINMVLFQENYTRCHTKLATTIDAIRRRHTSSNHAGLIEDFRKAFDNINCLYLLLTLTKLNVDDDTIRYCMAFTADHFGQIQLNNRLSRSVQIGRGTSGEPSIACTFQHRMGPLLQN